MVRTKTTATRRRAARPPRALTMPATPVVRPTAEMRTRLELALRTGRRFVRTTVREVMTAARESREPMLALFRNVRLAGRHIAREAVEAWQEVMPMPAMKPVMARRAKA